MIFAHTLASSGILALVAVRSVFAVTTISTACTDVTFRSNWLIANCLTGVDETTRIQSAIYLPNRVENRESVLNWAKGGRYQGSCRDCSLVNGGSALSCTCRTTFNQWNPTTLNLDEHIANYNGHLLSDLDGTPAIPADSSVPIPADFNYSYSLAVSKSDCTGMTWSGVQPYDCFSVDLTGLGPFSFASVGSLQATPSWELIEFEAGDCSGEPVARVGPEDGTTCKANAKLPKGFSIRPLFNGA